MYIFYTSMYCNCPSLTAEFINHLGAVVGMMAVVGLMADVVVL